MATANQSPLEGDIRRLLNMYGKDAASNTPDFLLAKFLTKSLNAFTETINERDNLARMSHPPNKKEEIS